MPDDRTFFKLHDGMPDHPKIVGLSDRAFRTLIAAWCYCSRYLTDGLIPFPAWAQIVPASGTKRGPQVVANVTRELAAAELVVEHPEHVEMHDYLDHQRSKAQVEHVRAVRSEAGRKGGRPSGRQATGNQNASSAESKTKAENREQRTEVEEEPPPVGSPSDDPEALEASEQARPPTRQAIQQRGTRLPDDFAPTDEMRTWARQRRPDLDIPLETEKFCNYWWSKPGKDGTKLDWNKTWRNWILNAHGNGHPPISRLPMSQERSQERINELHRVGDAGQAAKEAGIRFDWPNPPAEDDRDGLSRKEWATRYGQRWIVEHKTELLDGMTRKPA